MNEIIYKIDNWTLVKLLGGLGIILTAIIYFLSTLLAERLKASWNKSASLGLQDVKYQLEKNNSTIERLQSNYLFHVQNTHIKRVEAIEIVWNSVLEIREGIPSVISLCLSILQDSEINNAVLDKAGKEKTFGELVGKLDEAGNTLFVVDASNKVQKLRPFIKEELYSLFKTYVAVIGRTVHLFIWQYKQGKLSTWKSDENIRTLLKDVLTDQEFKHISTKRVGAFNDMMNLLELKMLGMMRNTLTGSDADIDTIKQIKTLEDIWQVEKDSPSSAS